jgi:hypothetical protein
MPEPLNNTDDDIQAASQNAVSTEPETPPAESTAASETDAPSAEPSSKVSRRKPRASRQFPALTFEEALFIPNLIQQLAAGQKVRRLTLFEHINESPDSKKSRSAITAAAQYGLTVGSYSAEHLELTPEGVTATSDETLPADRFKARFDLAIKRVSPFQHLYDKFKNTKVPVREVLVDSLSELDIEEDERAECVDTFIVNMKYLGMLRTIAGAERLVSFDHAYEDAKKIEPSTTVAQNSADQIANPTRPIVPVAGVQVAPTSQKIRVEEGPNEFANTCFYITPIGEEGSEPRRHADFIMEYIVKPALNEFGLKVVRADQMGKPGMIGKQLIEYILKSPIVIADLSFHNPNVFYEICLRHTTRLPIVQIIRASDKIPFDVNQYRTIPIETRDPYSLVPKIQTYVAEVANQVRRAMEDEEQSDNPISLYYPSAKLHWESE